MLALPLQDKRKELIEELFRETLERVGDREKEVVMRWWYDVRGELFGSGNERGDVKGEEGEGKAIPSRL